MSKTDQEYRRTYADELAFQELIVNDPMLARTKAQTTLGKNQRVWVVITDADWDKRTFTVRRILSGNRISTRLRRVPVKALKNVRRVRRPLRGR